MVHSGKALSFQSEEIGEFGSETLQDFSRHIEPETKALWNLINAKLGALTPAKARFYLEGFTQDSQNVQEGTGRLPMETDNASPEGIVIAKFIKRVGGTIEKTEDKELLDEEFMHARRVSEAFSALFNSFNATEDVHGKKQLPTPDTTTLDESFDHLDRLQTERDEFIAKRIQETLQEGETGFLFIGASHDVQKYLPQDIQTEVLDERIVELVDEIRGERKGEFLDTPPLTPGPEGKI